MKLNYALIIIIITMILISILTEQHLSGKFKTIVKSWKMGIVPHILYGGIIIAILFFTRNLHNYEMNNDDLIKLIVGLNAINIVGKFNSCQSCFEILYAIYIPFMLIHEYILNINPNMAIKYFLY